VDLNPSQWLAFVASTETVRLEEAILVMWVLRNRVAHEGFPDSFKGVALQPYQFSAFNHLGESELEDLYDYHMEHASDRMKMYEMVASEILDAGRGRSPFSNKVLYYYSPRSMVPAGKRPSWNWSILKPVAVQGIDPWRFVFAEETT
jgi:spore germination cell wall hydrolase CwlJ-like protein